RRVAPSGGADGGLLVTLGAGARLRELSGAATRQAHCDPDAALHALSHHAGHAPQRQRRGARMTAPAPGARPALLDAVPRRGHVVIEASAGTGKTYTLEHLVVDLLLTDRVEVDRILVVTFTEKGTEELRERVRSKLRRLAAGTGAGDPVLRQVEEGGWTLDEEARRALADAAVRF